MPTPDDHDVGLAVVGAGFAFGVLSRAFRRRRRRFGRASAAQCVWCWCALGTTKSTGALYQEVPPPDFGEKMSKSVGNTLALQRAGDAISERTLNIGRASVYRVLAS